MSDQKNMLIAIALSLAILLGFQFLYEFPKMEQERARQAQIEAQRPADQPVPDAPAALPSDVAAPGAPAAVVSAEQRSQALQSSPRVAIDTPTLAGSIDLRGGRIDDLVLRNYRQTTDPDSDLIRLFSPWARRAPTTRSSDGSGPEPAPTCREPIPCGPRTAAH